MPRKAARISKVQTQPRQQLRVAKSPKAGKKDIWY